jgi:hypothetical protein
LCCGANTETKWVVESIENGLWKAHSKTGLLLQPFWRSARVEYRQNRVLAAGDTAVSQMGVSRNTAAFRKLYETADAQGGFFTARQARKAAY